jgi:hypothetical protein
LNLEQLGTGSKHAVSKYPMDGNFKFVEGPHSCHPLHMSIVRISAVILLEKLKMQAGVPHSNSCSKKYWERRNLPASDTDVFLAIL